MTLDMNWLNRVNSLLMKTGADPIPETKIIMRDFLVYPDERIRLLDSIAILPNDAQLLEYGSGGSTETIASVLKPGQHLTSVEHNQKWFDTVNPELVELKLQDKVTLIFVPFNTKEYATQKEEDIIPGSEPYRNPPVDWSAIRWVFCDGIMRGPILSEIRSKLLPGTPVFLHDYIGRQGWYDKHLEGYDKLEPVHTLLPLLSKGQWLL